MCGREDGESDVGRAEVGLQRHSIFLFSRTRRAAHTLPFGAVTPRELWSPNEWLGRAKRRITYFFVFFFFFIFPRSRALFSRMSINTRIEPACLPQLFVQKRRGGPLVTRAWMLRVASRIGHVPEGARRDDDRSPGIFGIVRRVALIIPETYLSECVFCPFKETRGVRSPRRYF